MAEFTDEIAIPFERGLAEQIFALCTRHEELLIQLLAHFNGNAKMALEPDDAAGMASEALDGQGNANCPQMRSEQPSRDASTLQHAETQVVPSQHGLSQDDERMMLAIQEQAKGKQMKGVASSKHAREVEEDKQRREQAHSWIEKLFTSKGFERFFFTLIVSYAIFMGIDAELSVQAAFHNPERSKPSQTVVLIDFIYFVAFCIEALLRMAYWGRHFLTGRDGFWNTFDVLLLSLSALDYVLHGSGVNGVDLMIFRIFKLTNKLIRTLRLVNYLRFFEAFRVIIVGVTSSLRYFLWSMFAMGCIIYLASVCLVHGVAMGVRGGALHNSDDEIAQAAMDNWGSLSKTALTLYKTFTGGGAWGKPGEVLLELSKFHFVLLIMFISFMKFSVIKVLVGLFVAKSKSALDTDTKAIVELNLRELFRSLNLDHSGALSAKELLDSLADEQVKKVLNRLKISPLQLVKTFHVTDVSTDGKMNIKEFVGGFTKASAPAKGLDVQLVLKRLEAVSRELGIEYEHIQHLLLHKYHSAFHQ